MYSAKDRLARWLKDHPDDWLTKSFKFIGKEADVSASSADRYLPELIAERDNILPSEVMRRRQEAGLGHPGKSTSDFGKIRQVIEENPGADIRDLAYLAKCHPKAVKRVLNAIGQEQEIEENQSTSNEDETRRDAQTEMAKLEAEFEARRAALLKN